MEYKDRISINPKVMLGMPCIKGTRITVELIIRDLSEGMVISDLIKAYPFICKEDIVAALAYTVALLTCDELEEEIIET